MCVCMRVREEAEIEGIRRWEQARTTRASVTTPPATVKRLTDMMATKTSIGVARTGT